MVFYEEQSGLRKVFDLSGFPVPIEMQQCMARLLASRCGPRGGSKRTRTAQGYFDVLKRFATVLTKAETAGQRPAQRLPE